jgi:hypothetical protein
LGTRLDDGHETRPCNPENPASRYFAIRASISPAVFS